MVSPCFGTGSKLGAESGAPVKARTRRHRRKSAQQAHDTRLDRAAPARAHQRHADLQDLPRRPNGRPSRPPAAPPARPSISRMAISISRPRAQAAETAAKHFAGEDGLMLVAVEVDRLGTDLKWEPSRGGALFPASLPRARRDRRGLDHARCRSAPTAPHLSRGDDMTPFERFGMAMLHRFDAGNRAQAVADGAEGRGRADAGASHQPGARDQGGRAAPCPTRSALPPATTRTPRWSTRWRAPGFGFIEAGAITPRPQPGNPKPRLFRLYEDAAIINRMGFNNAGMEAAARPARAARRTPPGAGRAEPRRQQGQRRPRRRLRPGASRPAARMSISSPSTCRRPTPKSCAICRGRWRCKALLDRVFEERDGMDKYIAGLPQDRPRSDRRRTWKRSSRWRARRAARRDHRHQHHARPRRLEKCKREQRLAGFPARHCSKSPPACSRGSRR